MLRPIAILFSAAVLSVSALAANPLPKDLQSVGIFPQLGNQLNLSLSFQDEEGKSVELGRYFDGQHPIVLILNYYSCPMLCGLVLQQAKDIFKDSDWQLGEHYKAVTISIDPTETPSIAAAKKQSILGSIKDPGFRAKAGKNWHFLVGKKENIDHVAEAIGFHYKYVPEEKQYAHGAALFLLSPAGKLDRVLPALAISPKDLKLALLEAGEGKIGSLAEKFFALCYHYDPKESKYTIVATSLMKFGAALTLACFAVAYFLLYMRRNERKKS